MEEPFITYFRKLDIMTNSTPLHVRGMPDQLRQQEMGTSIAGCTAKRPLRGKNCTGASVLCGSTFLKISTGISSLMSCPVSRFCQNTTCCEPIEAFGATLPPGAGPEAGRFKALLADGYTIEDIAFPVGGFSDRRSFTKSFKKAFGVAPSVLREDGEVDCYPG